MTKIDFNKDIPHYSNNLNWGEVEIVENGEELINLNEITIKRIKTRSKYYYEKVPGSIKDIFIRKSLLEKLIEAIKLLPEQYTLLVWDGWRPSKVQEWLYKKSLIAKKNEVFDKENLPKEAEKFAANPDKSDKIPPHSTGGSVDITLMDYKGNLVNMGTDLDYFGIASTTSFYEMGKVLNEKFKKNRRILYWTMTNAGFTNYPMEWWHFDYGNQLWGLICNKKAIYGAIKNINQ